MARNKGARNRRRRQRRRGMVTTFYSVTNAGLTTAYTRSVFSLLGTVDRPFKIERISFTLVALSMPALVNVRLYDPGETDSVKCSGLLEIGSTPRSGGIRGTGRWFPGGSPANTTLVAIDNLIPQKGDKNLHSVMATVRLYISFSREEINGQNALLSSYLAGRMMVEELQSDVWSQLK